MRKKDLMDLYQSVKVPEGKAKDLHETRESVQKEIGKHVAEEGS